MSVCLFDIAARLEITDLCLNTVDNPGSERRCIHAPLVGWSSLGVGEAIGSVREGAIGEMKELGYIGNTRRSILLGC